MLGDAGNDVYQPGKGIRRANEAQRLGGRAGDDHGLGAAFEGGFGGAVEIFDGQPTIAYEPGIPVAAFDDWNPSHFLDVADPMSMKERLDPVSGRNFVAVANEACERAGVSVSDVSLLAVLHTKRSIHDWIVEHLGIAPERATYITRHGHMSGLDSLVGIEQRQDQLEPGDLVLMLAAGTGYTWAATLLRW